MKWPTGGLDPMLCRAIDSTGNQCQHTRERSGKTTLRTYCRGHRFRLSRFGALMPDVPLGRLKDELGPLSRT